MVTFLQAVHDSQRVTGERHRKSIRLGTLIVGGTKSASLFTVSQRVSGRRDFQLFVFATLGYVTKGQSGF